MVQFLAVNPKGCTGCRECEMICSLYHFGECNPERSAVRVIRNEGQGLAEPLPLVCQQCDEPACVNVCPSEAIRKSKDSELIEVDAEACTGCGDCTTACPAGCIFLNAASDTAMICDLCGGDPQCVPMCHAECLTLSQADGESDIIRVERLAKLLSRYTEEAAMTKGGSS